MVGCESLGNKYWGRSRWVGRNAGDRSPAPSQSATSSLGRLATTMPHSCPPSSSSALWSVPAFVDSELGG